MFTRTVDEAVARYETAEGVKIAFAYDTAPLNPVKECEYPIGIVRLERGCIATDPHGILEAWYRTEEVIDEADSMAWALGISLEEALAKLETDEELDPVDEEILQDCLDAMEERKGMARIEWADYKEYGHPTYEVVVDLEAFKKAGYNPDHADEIVKGMAREYSAFVCGSVYEMGVETPEGNEYYESCFPGTNPHDLEEVESLVIEMGFSPKGLKES